MSAPMIVQPPACSVCRIPPEPAAGRRLHSERAVQLLPGDAALYAPWAVCSACAAARLTAGLRARGWQAYPEWPRTGQ